jgi:ElaB/YqjD/DUF883 family membrane-anchored ribosome-binding protein
MADRDRFGSTQNVSGQGQTPVKPAGGYSDVSERSDSSTRERVADQAREQAEHAREVASEQRDRAAHGMERAADTIREHSDQIPGGQRTTDMANRAADQVEGVATYLQDADMSAIMQDVERVVRDHPRESLIAAAAVGFLVGRSLRS